MAGGIINLRQARKERARAEKRAKGDENAAKFGLTKDQRVRDKAEATRARDHLDAHKRDEE